MSATVPATALLARLERYYDAVPRSAATTEEVGPFTLFVSTGGWPYYARPRLGLAEDVTAADVDAVRTRQRELGVPEAVEWVCETTPSLAAACRASGLPVQELPLLVLQQPLDVAAPPGVTVRVLAPDEADLARIQATVALGFGTPGTALGDVGPTERDAQAAADPDDHARLRARLADGRTAMVVAEDASGPLAAGSHQPVEGVSEVVGVATLPSARRRGLGAAVTAALVTDARARGVDTVFLSAGSEDVARVYERVGFRRVGTAGIAEPA